MNKECPYHEAEKEPVPEPLVTGRWQIESRVGLITTFSLVTSDQKQKITRQVDFGVISVTPQVRYALELLFVLKFGVYNDPAVFETFLKAAEAQKHSKTYQVIRSAVRKLGLPFQHQERSEFTTVNEIIELFWSKNPRKMYNSSTGMFSNTINAMLFRSINLYLAELLRAVALANEEQAQSLVDTYLELRKLSRNSFHSLVHHISQDRIKRKIPIEWAEDQLLVVEIAGESYRRNVPFLPIDSTTDVAKMGKHFSHLARVVTQMAELLQVTVRSDQWQNLLDIYVHEMGSGYGFMYWILKRNIQHPRQLHHQLSPRSVAVHDPDLSYSVIFDHHVQKLAFKYKGKKHTLLLEEPNWCPHPEQVSRHLPDGKK